MKATQKSSSKIRLRDVRALPMFFQGRQQSEEFARGAWAACDLMRKMEEKDGSVGQVTTALADRFTQEVAGGGDYARGFVAAMIECIAFGDRVGAPNFDLWRPLEMELRYAKRGAHPTPGSELFDYAGIPVSVAPDRTVHTWAEEDPWLERSIDFLERVLAKGRPLSQHAFDSLRAKAVAQARARRAEKRTEAANG